MIVLNILFFIFAFLFSFIIYYTMIARNPYSSELYIGKKGAGKSTFMAKLSKYYNELGWKVFCTEKIPGTYHITKEDIGDSLFPENSVLLVDEAGILFCNRNWSKLGMEVIKYIKYSRHYKNKLVLFTQSDAEIDIAFKRILDKLALLSNYFNVIGKVRYLRYKQVLIPASELAEARITDDLVTVSPLLGGIRLYWMPKYWKLFDSYNKPLDLIPKEFEYTEFPSWINPFEPKEVTKRKKYIIKKANKTIKKCKRILKGA